ncbi:hypothetical protein BJ138DRAFT_302855 [Hygrophoropsis aurantiaca]|uniref:Uncharacterized protein n=1 Tax=Hygrophoropsis aurantiaca TaxID=72124 RepID=A0ACB8A875_9AGAM|nr:hypothetical protein BJ138DRAFT_302855 [Hygrophoropsis aurantiaca]
MFRYPITTNDMKTFLESSQTVSRKFNTNAQTTTEPSSHRYQEYNFQHTSHKLSHPDPQDSWITQNHNGFELRILQRRSEPQESHAKCRAHLLAQVNSTQAPYIDNPFLAVGPVHARLPKLCAPQRGACPLSFSVTLSAPTMCCLHYWAQFVYMDRSSAGRGLYVVVKVSCWRSIHAAVRCVPAIAIRLSDGSSSSSGGSEL